MVGLKWRLAMATVAVGVASGGSGASAATSVDTTACQGFAVSNSCRFDGNINSNTNGNNSYLHAQSAYNVLFDPNIVLNPIGESIVGAGATSGTWSLPGFNVAYLAVKAANTFVLYETSGSTGSWDTIGNGGNRHGQAQGMSHLVFFGAQAVAVPEPATWALLILGFGVVGAGLRRRQPALRHA